MVHVFNSGEWEWHGSGMEPAWSRHGTEVWGMGIAWSRHGAGLVQVSNSGAWAGIAWFRQRSLCGRYSGQHSAGTEQVSGRHSGMHGTVYTPAWIRHGAGM